jgi:hypothetical protein
MPKEAKSVQADPIDVTKARQQQHTGNHDKPGPERGGSDRHGGTRHGAENVESARPSPVRKPKKQGDPPFMRSERNVGVGASLSETESGYAQRCR